MVVVIFLVMDQATCIKILKKTFLVTNYQFEKTLIAIYLTEFVSRKEDNYNVIVTGVTHKLHLEYLEHQVIIDTNIWIITTSTS